jgi:hypothetical protein
LAAEREDAPVPTTTTVGGAAASSTERPVATDGGASDPAAAANGTAPPDLVSGTRDLSLADMETDTDSTKDLDVVSVSGGGGGALAAATSPEIPDSPPEMPSTPPEMLGGPEDEEEEEDSSVNNQSTGSDLELPDAPVSEPSSPQVRRIPWLGGHKEMSSTVAWLTNNPLSYEPKCRRKGGSCGVSTNEYSCAHGSQINFGDLTPYLSVPLVHRHQIMPSKPDMDGSVTLPGTSVFVI